MSMYCTHMHTQAAPVSLQPLARTSSSVQPLQLPIRWVLMICLMVMSGTTTLQPDDGGEPVKHPVVAWLVRLLHCNL